MNGNNTAIVELCLRMDMDAERVYRQLSRAAPSSELADFWRGMSDDETRHVAYWQRLLALTREGRIPNVFERSDALRAELEHCAGRVRTLVVQCRTTLGPEEPFLIACRMEFYLVHPAIGVLFHALDDASEERSPAADYEAHIAKLVKRFPRDGANPFELELLGETLRRLWLDNQRLVEQGIPGGMEITAKDGAQGASADPPADLAAVARVWPALRAPVREAIRVMIQRTGGEGDAG